MASKEELIEVLIKDGYLKTPVIIEAFKAVDRKEFVPEGMKQYAYANEALSIGYEQTISQPLVVAFMLELLNIKSGEKILEVGTGSGWQTAVMAYMSDNFPKTAQNEENKTLIISIERIKELNEFAQKNISKYNFIEKGLVKLILEDGSKGYLPDAPYDKIIAAASAKEMPEAWKEQLKIGGRIIAPVKESIVVIEKLAADKFETKEYMGFVFVPLVPKK